MGLGREGLLAEEGEAVVEHEEVQEGEGAGLGVEVGAKLLVEAVP